MTSSMNTMKTTHVVMLWLIIGFGLNCHAKESLVQLASPKGRMSMARIEKGAEHFKRSCLSCHSLKYAQYNEVLKQAGITKENMPVWGSEDWGGHPPPDLSLNAELNSPEWIYTYLITYYQDNEVATGFNNLAYPETSMPNPFPAMQGVQVVMDQALLTKAKAYETKPYWYRVIKLDKQGSMNAEAFDEYVSNIVHFLTYVADPSQEQRHDIGPYVMLFLGVSALVSYLMYRQYIKDHKSDKKRTPK